MASDSAESVAAGRVQLLSPQEIDKNPENPRLIFRQEELDSLQASIADQGILVPLTVFKAKSGYIILDGERRWRCAIRLGLPRIPVIVQPEPTRFQNILMMFAIHNARRDWDPLPTAYKLRDLEDEFSSREGRKPTEVELAQLASMSRGEVRRLKKLLDLPSSYHDELMAELQLPRSKQTITVDVILETTKGVEALVKRDVVKPEDEEPLRRAIVDKYRSKVMKNTVEPRQLARIARAVEREEIPIATARSVARRLLTEPSFGIQKAFEQAAAHADAAHTLEQLVDRTQRRLEDYGSSGFPITDSLRQALTSLRQAISRALRDR